MRNFIIAAVAGLTICLASGDVTRDAEAGTWRAYRRAAWNNYGYNRWYNTYYGSPSFYSGTAYHGGYAPGYYYAPPVYSYGYTYPSYSYPVPYYYSSYRYSYPSYGYYRYGWGVPRGGITFSYGW